MSYHRKKRVSLIEKGSFSGCGCIILILLLNVFIGSWSVNYLLEFFLDKTIAWGYAAGIGLFVGEFSIPVAFVMMLLEKAGIL